MNIGELAKFRGGIATDTISEQTAASGVTIDGMLIKDGQTSSNNISWQEPTMFRNRIINGCMRIVQRGTTFDSTTTPANNDDTYLLDRWYILSDGNDIVDVTQQTDAPSLIATSKCIRLDVETANKKFGIAQIIEADSCSSVIGGNVTFSFYAKVSATTNLDNVKCAIVSWSGTADSVTSDIVSAWEIEGTNPTLIANATYENTPSTLGVTTSWARYTVTAAVDTASTKQLILLIWSDVTTTSVGEFLYLTGVQLEPGTAATPFEFRPYGTELALCQRYYERITFHSDMRVAAVTSAGSTTVSQPLFLKQRKRTFTPNSAVITQPTTKIIRNITDTGDVSYTTLGINSKTEDYVVLSVNATLATAAFFFASNAVIESEAEL